MQLQTLASQNLASSFSQYRDDPVGFVTDVLQEFVWDKLAEALEAVRDHNKVAITGANAVGKGWVAARIALWWLNCFAPAKIVTTAAPPARQIKELLWAEIRGSQKAALRRGVPLCGKEPQTLAIRTDDPHHWAQGFIIPLSGTREERISKFQGHHSPHMLFLFDEAHGVPEEIYDAADSCLSSDHNHFALLSNPLAPSGPFYRRVRSGRWHVIHIDAFDHPNVKEGREIVPGAVTREKTYDRILLGSRPLRKDEAEALAEGKGESRLPEEALFEVPVYFEAQDRANPGELPIAGTTRVVVTAAMATKVLGRFPLQGTDSLINLMWLHAAQQRYKTYVAEFGIEPPTDEMAPKDIISGLDVAEFGDDENALTTRYDWFVSPFELWNGVDPIATGDIAMDFIGDPRRIVHVDGTGVGAGTAPYMKRNGFRKAYSIKMGSSATLKVKQTTKVSPQYLPAQEFDRMRSQAFWLLREWLRTHPKAAIPPDEELEADLMVLTYEKTPSERLKVLPKKDVRELLRRSPNKGDALALTFAQGGKRWSTPEFLSLATPSATQPPRRGNNG